MKRLTQQVSEARQHHREIAEKQPTLQNLPTSQTCTAVTKRGVRVSHDCSNKQAMQTVAVANADGQKSHGDELEEDYLLTLRLKETGFSTAYLNEPLSYGLAPEGLKEYVSRLHADRPQRPLHRNDPPVLFRRPSQAARSHPHLEGRGVGPEARARLISRAHDRRSRHSGRPPTNASNSPFAIGTRCFSSG